MDRSTLRRLAVALLGIAPAARAIADDPPTRPRARIVQIQVDGPSAQAPAVVPTRDPALRRAGAEVVVEQEPAPVLASAVQDPSVSTRPPATAVPVPLSPPAPQARGATPPRDLDQRLQVDSRGRLTLHMDDLDIRRGLELLSRQGSLNIMIAPGVTGRVTANLEGVTVEQALAAVLKLTNLTARREGSLIYVYSPEEYKQLAYHNQEIGTRIYKLNYIRATDTMGMIQDLLSPEGTMTSTPPSREGISESPSFSSGGSPSGGGGGGGGGGGATAPSSGGGGGGGGGTGSTGGNSMAGGDVVIVRDYQANLKAIDEIVAQLDVQPIQVLVEAVIISVELSRNQELGVNYAVVDNMATTLGTIGSGTDLVANSGFTPAKLLTIPVDATAAGLAAAGRLNGGTADGGFNSSTNGIKFGFVSKNNSGFIRALETLGEVRVLASPRLLVLNKQRAEIQLGQRLGYATTTQNFTSTTQQIQFLNTGTLLRLRPFVSSDGMVRMEIHPERSSGSTPGGIPQTNTAELTTNIMIPDGSTLVIGGLMENERDYNQEGLPGLNRLPILGAAFGFKTRGIGKRELIVLLTPHIWKQGAIETCPPPGMTDEPLEMQAASAGRKPSASPADGRVAAREAAAPAPAKQHVVREGEDLWSISKLYYGSGRHFQALWDANRDRVASPESIPVGTALRVPPVADLERLAGTGAVAAPGAAPRPSATLDRGAVRAGYEATAPRRAEPPRAERPGPGDEYPVHVVGRNETLRSIARERLGDPRRASEILALNRDILAGNDRPSPGLHLYLPRDARPRPK